MDITQCQETSRKQAATDPDYDGSNNKGVFCLKTVSPPTNVETVPEIPRQSIGTQTGSDFEDKLTHLTPIDNQPNMVSNKKLEEMKSENQELRGLLTTQLATAKQNNDHTELVDSKNADLKQRNKSLESEIDNLLSNLKLAIEGKNIITEQYDIVLSTNKNKDVEITSLIDQVSTLFQVNENFQKESTEQRKQIKELSGMIAKQSAIIKNSQQQLQVSPSVSYIERSVISDEEQNGNFYIMRINNIIDTLFEIQDPNNVSISSVIKSRVFTLEDGYKLQVHIYPNGNRKAKDKFLSINAKLISGDSDYDLKWPFDKTMIMSVMSGDTPISSGDQYEASEMSDNCKGNPSENKESQDVFGFDNVIEHRTLIEQGIDEMTIEVEFKSP